MGKACAMYGGYGDCTAFMNKGQKATSFGKMLTSSTLVETRYYSTVNLGNKCMPKSLLVNLP